MVLKTLIETILFRISALTMIEYYGLLWIAPERVQSTYFWKVDAVLHPCFGSFDCGWRVVQGNWQLLRFRPSLFRDWRFATNKLKTAKQVDLANLFHCTACLHQEQQKENTKQRVELISQREFQRRSFYVRVHEAIFPFVPITERQTHRERGTLKKKERHEKSMNGNFSVVPVGISKRYIKLALSSRDGVDSKTLSGQEHPTIHVRLRQIHVTRVSDLLEIKTWRILKQILTFWLLGMFEDDNLSL
jgi:hypothetical protein